MGIGYACKVEGNPLLQLKSCVLKNACQDRLYEITAHNLKILDAVLDYNHSENIHLFRISSDIVPFASHPAVSFNWQAQFERELYQIGNKATQYGMRLSMHPGQYTVLNTTSLDTLKRSIADLQYHGDFLSALGLGQIHKLVLHIGGIYGDKEAAMQRFIQQFDLLDSAIKKRVIIENDDKLYNIADVLKISRQLKLPVVFDILHHQINPPDENNRSTPDWIADCNKTWKKEDGIQKIHYSQQAEGGRPGAHSQTIAASEFLGFYDKLETDIDIMLEVKDKNLSAVKCACCTETPFKIRRLEREWAKYKYAVLERSPSIYSNIRELLKQKTGSQACDFYNFIDAALSCPLEQGHSMNAAQHIWGYFKKIATSKEKQSFEKKAQSYLLGKGSINPIKKQLLQLSHKYQISYLIDSYYFYL